MSASLLVHRLSPRLTPADSTALPALPSVPPPSQDKAEAVRRKQMKHVLFTTPEVVEVSGQGWLT